ncbi:MAG: carbohydrate kinase family protein [Clostridia bacterium]|nr:carbohydrate kinase family protein [Clostridia bacterium]
MGKVDGGDGVKILKSAKENGIDTSIDLVSENSDRYETVLPCLPYTDYLVINELEAGKLTGIEPEVGNITTTARKLLCLGVNKTVIIHFPDGSVCANKNGDLTALGSYDLPKGYIKGTTGAGDAFCAGALVGIAEGLSDEEILALATNCATMALGTEDATSGLTDVRTAHNICKIFERKSLCL